MTARKRKARRQRETIERRAAIAPYIRELERSKVPPLTIKTAKVAMLLLLSGKGTGA